MTPEMQKKYKEHINSARWRNTRALMVKMAGNKCQQCGAVGFSTEPLEVHHKTYDRLGKESMGDLEVLCKRCHEIADGKRAEAGRRKSERALSDAIYYNGQDTYMTKKYGENWIDGGHDHEEFDRWLETRPDY